jgi:hypothetical protein
MSDTIGSIVDPQTVTTELVLSERVVTNEFVITEIFESIVNRFVRAEIELGPFISESRPDGSIQVKGSSRRGITVWENAGYDAVRDTWRNEDLIAQVKNILNG